MLYLWLKALHSPAISIEQKTAGRNPRSQKFYRIANEIPTILMIGIVILAVVKPF